MKKILYILFITLVISLSTSCDKQTPEPTGKITLHDDLDYSCFLNDTININLLENDDIAGEVNVIVDPPANGTLQVQSNGLTFKYTPNSGFLGIDVFHYKVCNSEACEIAKVQIEVAAGLDACEEIFEAKDDYMSMEVGAKKVFPMNYMVLNDIACREDRSLQYFTIIRQPKHGEITELIDGYLVYTPDIDFKGEDTFDYQVKASTNLAVKSIATVHFSVGIEVIIE